MNRFFALFCWMLLGISAVRGDTLSDRQLWSERTQGENLALGKKAMFVPTPGYRLTHNDTDATDLTDGQWATYPNDRIWFDRKSVGWYQENGLERFVKIDLEQEQPVGKMVVRCLGGTTGNFRFPQKFDVYVSKDGETFFEAASMQKLQPCEASQAEPNRFFYVEEFNEHPNTRVYPFMLEVNAVARFVLVKITGTTGSVFCDELALLKATEPVKNVAYEKPGKRFPLTGLVAQTRWPKLGIIQGVPAPQHFMITDLRADEVKNESTELVLELPSEVSIVGQTVVEKLSKEGHEYARYVFPIKENKGNWNVPVVYLTTEKTDVSLPAYLYATCGGKPQFVSELPIEIVTLPAFEPFEKLHVSLAWMGEKQQQEWPEYFTNAQRLGFNAVGAFPRYWPKNGDISKQREHFDAARKAGFQVVMNESPFHVMMNGHKPGDEIYCQIPGTQCATLCPSYRGEFYQKEMERVTDGVRKTRPDYVYYDIECWHQAKATAVKCIRCQEALKASGKTLEEFLFDRGTETQKDLYDAVTKGSREAGIPLPILGSYNRQPLKPIYGIEEFSQTYPQYLFLAQPSLYIAGRARDVHENIRKNHSLLGNNAIIPYLSAGCYGEFEPYKMEHLVLESLLNGVRGITYYCFTDFDTPLDYYYHAKALCETRPYETLLAEGTPWEVTGTNVEMLYSAMRKGNEALILVGNYDRSQPQTEITLSESATTVRDVREGKEIPATGKVLKLEVPRGDVRLIYCKF